MYSPYDKMLDKTYQQGLVLEDNPIYRQATKRPSSSRKKKMASRPKNKPVAPPLPPPPTKVFAFHRQYVTDFDAYFGGIKASTDKKELTKKLRKELKKIQMSGQADARFLPNCGVAYLVPHTGEKGKIEKEWSSWLSSYSQALVLGAMDRLIGMQEVANANIRLRDRTEKCCP
jgi:hypothetical protein